MPERNRLTSCELISAEVDERKIDAIFSEVNQCHLPGAAVGIAIAGRPVYRKGFGLANMELPIVLSPTIRMRIGSTTKHFAALAYMLLCETGKANLDDPVCKYLPELHPTTHRVTMKQLMGNISGLRDALDMVWVFSGYGRRVSTDEIVSTYREIADANAVPGTAWMYNNGGWQILTVAIERITQKPLEDVLRESLFEPLGMSQSVLRRTDHDFLPNSAAQHMTNSAGRYEKNERSNLFATSVAAEGGIVSTVDDMLRWLANMDSHRVGSTRTWNAMKEPLTLVNGTSTGYGLGLVTGRYRGIETLFHPGGGTGSNAQMLKVPSAALDIVCMVNRHDASSYGFVNAILDACLPGREPVRKTATVALRSGIFHSQRTGCVIEFRHSTNAYWIREEKRVEDQYIVAINGHDSQFVAGDDGLLRPAGMTAFGPREITLVGARANPNSIVFNDYGNVDELVAASPAERIDASSIVGRYRCASLAIEITISCENGGQRLRTMGRFGSTEYPLEYLAEGIWRVVFPKALCKSGIISFDGRTTGFRFSDSCTRALPFRRIE